MNAGLEVLAELGHGIGEMKDAEHAPAQFLKLLDIAERQKHVIEQWRRAQALGPTDDQLWEAELDKITAEFHGQRTLKSRSAPRSGRPLFFHC
jgi:hypothetical protein